MPPERLAASLACNVPKSRGVIPEQRVNNEFKRIGHGKRCVPRQHHIRMPNADYGDSYLSRRQRSRFTSGSWFTSNYGTPRVFPSLVVHEVSPKEGDQLYHQSCIGEECACNPRAVFLQARISTSTWSSCLHVSEKWYLRHSHRARSEKVPRVVERNTPNSLGVVCEGSRTASLRQGTQTFSAYAPDPAHIVHRGDAANVDRLDGRMGGGSKSEWSGGLVDTSTISTTTGRHNCLVINSS